MKNVVKTLIVVSIFALPLVGTVSAAFPDVPEDHMYSDAINYVQEQGVISGFSDNTYRPEDSITRAEFTKIIIKTKYPWAGDRSLSFEEVVDVYEKNSLHSCFFAMEGISFYSDFKDVEPIYWDRIYLGEDERGGNEFSVYTCIAKGKDILNGYPDSTFRPDNSITFGEASKIISNAYGFTDIQSGPEGDVFKPFIDVLAERNAIPTTIISIDSELNRGEMSEIIYRLENNIIDNESKNYEDLKWIDFSTILECDACNWSNIMLKGKMPFTSTYKLEDEDSTLKIISDNFELNIGIFFEAKILGYDSYEIIERNGDFDGIVRFSDNSEEDEYYYSSIGEWFSISDSCNYVGHEIATPCGISSLVYQEDDSRYILPTICKAESSEGVRLCDKIVSSFIPKSV